MTHDLERNKRTVTDFYDLMFNQCRPREAIDKYAGEAYVQHNPHVADGKDAVVSTIFAVGQVLFAHFEEGTPKWRRTTDSGAGRRAAQGVSARKGRPDP